MDQLQATGERKLAMITLSRPQLISASQSALHQSKVLQETMREDVGREVEVNSSYCSLHRLIDGVMQELCPSRNIRSFRVVRARDTKASDYGMEAQITVYDVLSMGENALVEGTRYWVDLSYRFWSPRLMYTYAGDQCTTCAHLWLEPAQCQRGRDLPFD